MGNAERNMDQVTRLKSQWSVVLETIAGLESAAAVAYGDGTSAANASATDYGFGPTKSALGGCSQHIVTNAESGYQEFLLHRNSTLFKNIERGVAPRYGPCPGTKADTGTSVIVPLCNIRQLEEACTAANYTYMLPDVGPWQAPRSAPMPLGHLAVCVNTSSASVEIKPEWMPMCVRITPAQVPLRFALMTDHEGARDTDPVLFDTKFGVVAEISLETYIEGCGKKGKIALYQFPDGGRVRSPLTAEDDGESSYRIKQRVWFENDCQMLNKMAKNNVTTMNGMVVFKAYPKKIVAPQKTQTQKEKIQYLEVTIPVVAHQPLVQLEQVALRVLQGKHTRIDLRRHFKMQFDIGLGYSQLEFRQPEGFTGDDLGDLGYGLTDQGVLTFNGTGKTADDETLVYVTVTDNATNSRGLLPLINVTYAAPLAIEVNQTFLGTQPPHNGLQREWPVQAKAQCGDGLPLSQMYQIKTTFPTAAPEGGEQGLGGLGSFDLRFALKAVTVNGVPEGGLTGLTVHPTCGDVVWQRTGAGSAGKNELLEEGAYSVVVTATDTQKDFVQEDTAVVNFTVVHGAEPQLHGKSKREDSANTTIVASTAGVLVVILLLAGNFVYFKYLYTSGPPVIIYEFAFPDPDEWEYDRDRLSFDKELGRGAFGLVRKAQADGIKDHFGVKDVAVKQCAGVATAQDKHDFVEEAQLMKLFKHVNVISLLGVCLQQEPLFLIVEMMENGSLKEYLRAHHGVEMHKLLHMALDISSGLAYLADLNHIHRDLACRNCLLDGTLTAKIADFGMSHTITFQDYYRVDKHHLLPVRWMPVESLVEMKFSKETDVWSLGIVFWELSCHCEMPYPGLGNEEVKAFVVNGGRLQKPPACPAFLYEMCLQCWSSMPSERPSADGIRDSLAGTLNVSVRSSSLHSAKGYKAVTPRHSSTHVPMLEGTPHTHFYPPTSGLDGGKPFQDEPKFYSALVASPSGRLNDARGNSTIAETSFQSAPGTDGYAQVAFGRGHSASGGGGSGGRAVSSASPRLPRNSANVATAANAATGTRAGTPVPDQYMVVGGPHAGDTPSNTPAPSAHPDTLLHPPVASAHPDILLQPPQPPQPPQPAASLVNENPYFDMPEGDHGGGAGGTGGDGRGFN